MASGHKCICALSTVTRFVNVARYVLRADGLTLADSAEEEEEEKEENKARK
jgi:hypothetical protein